MIDDSSHSDVEKKVYAEALRKTSQDYEELVEQFSLLRLLNDSFQAGLGFTDICSKVVQRVTESLNVENASVMVMDHEKKELRLLVAKNFYEDKGTIFVNSSWPGKVFRLGEGIAGQVAKSRKSILIDDTLQDPRFVEADGQKVNVRSILSLPLIHGEHLHGVLNLSNSDPGAFDGKREHVLNIIASTASVALSHAIIVEKLNTLNMELTARNKELAAVIALSESLHANLDLDAVLAESLENVLNGFEIDTVAVFWEDEETGAMELKSYKTRSSESGLELLLRSLRARVSRDMVHSDKGISYLSPFEEAPCKEMSPSLPRACFAVPLSPGENRRGILMAISSSENGLKQAEIELMRSFCNQISVAIHNSILVSRLRENINELQKTRHQLIQSDKLALLGEMLSGVAHEINNPLTAITGYTELLLREPSLSEQNQAMLGKVALCADRCQKIVHGLSSFARKADLQKKRVNINELIEKVLEHRDYDFMVKDIQIVKVFETNSPMVTVDPNQIEQVFLNLVNNAFDSMVENDSPGRLEIRTRLIKGPAMQVEFIDNGPGIKEDNTARVFEPFFTTKEVGKGTGLGLSVSYGIIKEHGGTLYLDHTYHDGARFVITLPIINECHVEEPPPSTATDIPVPPQSSTSILVVDDEEVITDFVKLALSSQGFAVDCASDGEEAYELLNSNQYDLVITDIRMPGEMDGQEFFVRVRNERPEVAKRFVFISGDLNKRETAEFLEESGRAFLLKPFSIKNLEEFVDKSLRELDG